MITLSLQHFCNHTQSAGAITESDVRRLVRHVLPDGITSRDEADMLIALERAVPQVDRSFGDFLIQAVVDFAVWGERPTGRIERETAAWLAGSLAGRTGPTPVGARIAVEIVREAHASAENLTVFALEANRWTRQPTEIRRPVFALAA
ncbi:hypothetical protein [Methylobacterium dankookense]|uniref:Uncharacterized protein n=1 Tax=Methylobacterium dankookense TaxID=560405 RepID=A0A564G5N8_9HYPH|nr:hypothetical protein [Methylobacterium dankookense]GJD59248.1 hypothetical protein IFDJLNFL_5175 [Methylobacterium dankookense]VUF15344.1 hypothetical protein MTDSW087_05082 [Methylobacterium dankookense]